MQPIAIILLIFAAFGHAGWNLISKGRSPTPAFLLVANSFGTLVLLPFALFHMRVYTAFPAAVWGWLLLTGVVMAIYYAALALAYRRGELSVIYPLARSLPMAMVTLVTILSGRAGQVSSYCIAGMVLIGVGAILLPLSRFRDFHWRHYLNTACMLAVLAAAATAAYSMIDDTALRILREDGALQSLCSGISYWPGVVGIILLYSFFEGLSASFWLSFAVFSTRGGRSEVRVVVRHHKRAAFCAGTVILATYATVLVSLGFVSNVSYVVAFRQLSIPIGTLLGIYVLRESRPLPKLIGVALMFVGLIMVALG